MATIELDTPVQYVKGVGPRRGEQLLELGITTVEDLLMYFPRRFDLRRQAQAIDTLKGDEPAATVAGVVCDTKNKTTGKLPYFAATLDDGTAVIVLRWFHGGYLQGRIVPGMVLAAAGKVSVYQEVFQLINPKFQVIGDPGTAKLDEDELLPVYPATANLPSSLIARLVKTVLPEAPRLVRRWFDADFLERRHFPDRPTAIVAMHRPEDKDRWAAARRRLAYDEFYLMQLGIGLERLRTVSRPAHPLALTGEIDRRIRARFPFQLTAAQDRAILEISADLARNRPANRLLQGDVGSGKTVVALYAALLAVAHRKQAAIMAPTEILARQHHEKIVKYLAGSRVRIALLVGATKPADKADILARLAAGEIDVIVGTHALITPSVQFAELALVVVDEQHKFGVMQRSGFRAKGHAPHCLVMTATPIPRTLALTVFGDLDVSVIDQLPPGRGRTLTQAVELKNLPKVIEFVRARVVAGQQAYFVFPQVIATDQRPLMSAEDAYAKLTKAFPNHAVGLIHGQMPADQSRDVMARFTAGAVNILVASTIVEVGLDVANANVMVVVHADRFGLAQLHQLRGRIGRGKDDAACILVSGTPNPLATERLKVLVETTDGFKIAEADLRLRGPGEFFGTRQHGLPELKIADLIDDYDLLRLARRDAFAMVESDPDLSAPHNQNIRRELLKLYGDRVKLVTTG